MLKAGILKTMYVTLGLLLTTLVYSLAIGHCLSQCESTWQIQQFKVKSIDLLLNVVASFVSRKNLFVSVAFQRLFRCHKSKSSPDCYFFIFLIGI